MLDGVGPEDEEMAPMVWLGWALLIGVVLVLLWMDRKTRQLVAKASDLPHPRPDRDGEITPGVVRA